MWVYLMPLKKGYNDKLYVYFTTIKFFLKMEDFNKKYVCLHAYCFLYKEANN